MSGRAVGAQPTKLRYRDYTRERLVSEGKLAPAAEVQVTPQISAPAGALGGQELYDRLVARFGLGDCPAKREALYKRIVRLATAQPSLLVLVYEAADKATSARQPDRYFSAAVVRLLRGGWEVSPL